MLIKHDDAGWISKACGSIALIASFDASMRTF
jgi:hypothetical protein